MLYLADDIRRPFAGEGEVHPGAVGAHLATRDLRPEVLPDHTGEHVQGGVVAHVGVAAFPVDLPAQLPNCLRERAIEDVDDPSSLAPRVHHVRADWPDTQSSLIRRLASAAGVEGGTVQDHLPPGELDHPRLELPEVRVFQEELFGHRARVPRSRFLKVTTSR